MSISGRRVSSLVSVGLLSKRIPATIVSMGMLWAEGKGAGYWARDEVVHIRDLSGCYGLQKWGWVIYRCTYGDDSAWSSFLDQLKNWHVAVLQDLYQANDLVAPSDWIIQEDPALDGATKDEVRRRFRQFRSALFEAEVPKDLEDWKKQALMRESSRYNYCVHVDSAALQSVLQQGFKYTGPPASATCHVNVVRADESWDLPDFDHFDWTKYEAEQKPRGASNDGAIEADEDDDEYDDEYDEDDYNEGHPEIEGSRLADVGWMKVRAGHLISAYSTLFRGWLWDDIYSRPPQVVEI